ncbi:MAG TPA: NADH-quinone oxidoreductase subunit NuoE [Nitrospirota bacterium]|nr:NADH-quinone oxidoreductase subunit NuoE [Nitrospirota bacterium]
MLTEQEKKEIDEELNRSVHKRAACVDALKIVQRRRGWVSDESLAEIAGLLDMTTEELDSVATFYNLIYRRPVGRHVVLLCDSISCWIVGQEELYAHLKKRLGIDWGQTTPDNKFTLLPVACLGACDLAPAMMIDDELHGGLTPQKLDEILDTMKHS